MTLNRPQSSHKDFEGVLKTNLTIRKVYENHFISRCHEIYKFVTREHPKSFKSYRQIFLLSIYIEESAGNLHIHFSNTSMTNSTNINKKS